MEDLLHLTDKAFFLSLSLLHFLLNSYFCSIIILNIITTIALYIHMQETQQTPQEVSRKTWAVLHLSLDSRNNVPGSPQTLPKHLLSPPLFGLWIRRHAFSKYTHCTFSPLSEFQWWLPLISFTCVKWNACASLWTLY